MINCEQTDFCSSHLDFKGDLFKRDETDETGKSIRKESENTFKRSKRLIEWERKRASHRVSVREREKRKEMMANRFKMKNNNKEKQESCDTPSEESFILHSGFFFKKAISKL